MVFVSYSFVFDQYLIEMLSLQYTVVGVSFWPLGFYQFDVCSSLSEICQASSQRLWEIKQSILYAFVFHLTKAIWWSRCLFHHTHYSKSTSRPDGILMSYIFIALPHKSLFLHTCLLGLPLEPIEQDLLIILHFFFLLTLSFKDWVVKAARPITHSIWWLLSNCL